MNRGGPVPKNDNDEAEHEHESEAEHEHEQAEDADTPDPANATTDQQPQPLPQPVVPSAPPPQALAPQVPHVIIISPATRAPQPCRHKQLTRKGSNQYCIKITCCDCGELLHDKRM